MKTAVTLLALSFLHVCSSVPVSRPTNWLRQCRASTNLSITALEVLPGGGWDNLRNMDMGRVMNLSYSQCQTTEDGLYLIPDEVFVIPQKQTGVETSSEIISSWLEQKSSTSHSINADISFLTVLNGKFSVENTRMKTHQVKDSSTTARVQVSTTFYPGITLQKWQESTRNNLVAIDRSGFPLHYFINTNTLTDLPHPTIGKVALKVSQAVERYYKINTRPGCVDVNSKNFNFQANMDDNSCEGPATNLSFGGVYQECVKISSDADPLCDALAQKNPDTGDFSCRPPYSPTLLRSEVRLQSYSKYECHRESHSCWGFFTCHKTRCQDNNYVRSARINTYWCSINGQAPENSGYLFGGIYSPSLLNPLTKSKSCPPNFIPVNFFSDGEVICMSNDYEAGTRFSVPFGGLFSCQSTNPLASNQRRCPPKFSQHLAAISDGCEILYCVQSGLFTGGELKPIRLPPFTKRPLISMQATNTVMVMTEGENSWVRVGQTKMWKLAKTEEIQEIVQGLNPEVSQMSNGEKAGVVFGVMGVMLMVAIVGVVLFKRRRRMSGFRSRGYEEIREEVERESQEDEAPEQNTA
ncbi:macrophage-expressed gene 1 protein-like [Neolamprologus brichardi]|uniref:macrophage-expressed gene 1 protein-like n=1 Tax=Neolamprologus brichardi TaxID=32507 RepID=UPI00164385D1|nr:macrophage-expressed gene 1 protein-like [Neolamprologus brichardi]